MHDPFKKTPSALGEGFRVDRALAFVWRASPGWSVVCLALLLIQSVTPLATLYVFKLIVDFLTQVATHSGTAGNPSVLFEMVGCAFGIALLGSLSNAWLGHANTAQAQLVSDHMQKLVQAKSIEVDLEYYENPQFFDKFHRAQREAPGRPVRIVQVLTNVIRSMLTLVGAFVILASFHWGIVAAVLVASSPVFFFRLKQADDLYALDRKRTVVERTSKYLNQIITTGDNAKEVRVFGFGPLLMARFGDLRRDIRNDLLELSAHGYRREFVTETTAAAAGFGSLAFIAHSALIGSTSLGDLVMYFGAFQVAMGSLRPALGGLAQLYENNLFLSSLFEFLSVPKAVADPANPLQIHHPWRTGLAVENLSFRYPGTDELILDGVSLTIRPGEIVALVGRNGSGKTSLTKLLCRLYDPTTGAITIDGIDIREFASNDTRQQLSVIYQDYGRYHMTARENIRIGRPELSPDAPVIVEAAKWAGIHDELMGLPNGYDTVLSRTLANGEELSIGQWQKLALARAYVRDSQLIILDEPTSSLDAAAEFAFFEQFRAMALGRSALVISHRFSTVRLADRVYVLDGGRIIEEGTHDQLVAKNGLYADLYRQQASYYETDGLRDTTPESCAVRTL